ncbi:MAG: flagellar hook-associated protein FlgK [Rhizobiaceae bacterium]|nr:flagellar hook-associated protein FlgK [Rhizobiaceae bacterium]
MSLSSALSIAQSALLNTSRQTSVVSRNVSEANNPDYSRRTAILSTSANGAQVVTTQRTTNEALFRQNLAATSAAASQSALLSGLNTLNFDVNGIEYANSAATMLGKFQEAMQIFSATPSNRSVAENAIDAAKSVVRSLNEGTDAIQAFRTNVDRQIDSAVEELNNLLADFKIANDQVMAGTRAGRDVNEQLDQRDKLLKQISEYIPVNTITRADNDLMLVSATGQTLFEKIPREVTFDVTVGLQPGSTGNTIYVDGVPVIAGSGGNTTAGGKLAAFVQLREDVSGGMQAQLDEIARGLIEAFRETDPNGVDPDAAGLFTWSGAPGLPPAGTLIDGLARDISINAAFDTQQGGDPALLRDGGANGAAYVHNTSGGTSYSDLLLGYAARLDEPITFDPAAGINGTISVSTYSTESISWFSDIRQDASQAADSKNALMARIQEALSNETGVNIDEEMTLLLDLEHTYEASARLLKAVDDMLVALLGAVN